MWVVGEGPLGPLQCLAGSREETLHSVCSCVRRGLGGAVMYEAEGWLLPKERSRGVPGDTAA